MPTSKAYPTEGVVHLLSGQVAREPPWGVVGHADGLVLRVKRDDGSTRTEDLLSHEVRLH